MLHTSRVHSCFTVLAIRRNDKDFSLNFTYKEVSTEKKTAYLEHTVNSAKQNANGDFLLSRTLFASTLAYTGQTASLGSFLLGI